MIEVDKKIKVLIVDDSAFMRRVITAMLESDNQVKVVAFARNGKDAITKIKLYKPDVVTMDIEMPELDGLEALKKIMDECPTPVVMLSSLTTSGTRHTIEALELGAIDFVAKPTNKNEFGQLAKKLVRKVKEAAEISPMKISSVIQSKSFATTIRSSLKQKAISKIEHIKTATIQPIAPVEVVVIGISTGGPSALQILLKGFDFDFPCGIVIVQHMPKGFTGPLAKRLDEMTCIEVKEGRQGDIVKPGRAILAPAGYHTVFKQSSEGLQINLIEYSNIKTAFKPSVDVMMFSAIEHLESKVLGVIMTGMGKDGLSALKCLKAKRGIILAQNEESSVVFGMPRVAIDAGIVDKVLHLEELSEEITSIVLNSRRLT